ncbi:glycosyl transferase [Hungatella hathewayi]|uniref:Glycosyl transferase n=1 Tax=Hungatella hathewayi TaxID=154046 RepID=A0AA37JDK0_9FIRM|nr:glycosyltransferase [Hungatella hathewayi]GKG99043.1 glycosyl transferase [Hungatella hathewayi]GKH05867.1 glycosyl transferase [Hungatella hathewayi]
MPYSVLMSVYEKEQPEFLMMAIDSILDQTEKTNNFVIVCDGPLNEKLDNVLRHYKNRYPDVFSILYLNKNMGLGIALNEGLKICKNELVARMDSDDISVPNRIELQMACFSQDKDLSVCGGYIAEFEESADCIVSIRTVPCANETILRWAKRRNPMNHMTVMFKKSSVISVGGYKQMDLAEDYYLWVRMLLAGNKMINLDNILVKARIGNGMYQRRGGIEYVKRIFHIQRAFFDIGFINRLEFYINVAIRTVNSLLPNSIRKKIYKNFLRINGKSI